MTSQGDVPIVRKLDERSDPAQHGVGLQPVQKREVVLHVQAESLDNMRKQATVRIDQPKGSTFQIILRTRFRFSLTNAGFFETGASHG